jgi:hypothetical protein
MSPPWYRRVSPLVLNHPITKSSLTCLDLVNHRLDFSQHHLCTLAYQRHQVLAIHGLSGGHQSLSTSLHIHPSPLQSGHELAWLSQLSLTISMLNTCILQDKIHVAHTTTHAMVSLNTKPKLNNLLTITHHTWAYIHHVFATSLQISTIDF